MDSDQKGKRVNHKFTPEEDNRLKKFVNNFGESAWDDIAALMPGRNPRQCHDRWTYYLSPTINNSPWTEEEDKRIIKLQPEFKGKWVQMSKRFKGRTDIQLKNRWNVLKKSLVSKKSKNIPKKEKSTQKDQIPTLVNSQKDQNVFTFGDVFDQLFNLFGDQEGDESGFAF